MSVQLITCTVDCAEPAALARWYVAAFGGEILNDRGGFVLARLEDAGINLGFQRVPEPKIAKSRAHLDFMADDRVETVQKLVEAGATQVEQHAEGPYVWTVLRDPQGLELCILQRPET